MTAARSKNQLIADRIGDADRAIDLPFIAAAARRETETYTVFVKKDQVSGKRAARTCAREWIQMRKPHHKDVRSGVSLVRTNVLAAVAHDATLNGATYWKVDVQVTYGRTAADHRNAIEEALQIVRCSHCGQLATKRYDFHDIDSRTYYCDLCEVEREAIHKGRPATVTMLPFNSTEV